MLSVTLSQFPASPAAKDDGGVPFGCIVQPLAPIETDPDLPAAEDAIRCSGCYAYISPYCVFLRDSWRCALCGALTKTVERYATSQDRRFMPELVHPIVEYEYAEPEVGGCSGQGGESEDYDEGQSSLMVALPELPVCIALVDVSADSNFIDVAQAGLLAAVRALGPDSLFALVAFSDTLGIHLLGSPTPHVRHIPIPKYGEPGIAMFDAAPPHRMFAHVGTCHDRITAAIAALRRQFSMPAVSLCSSPTPRLLSCRAPTSKHERTLL